MRHDHTRNERTFHLHTRGGRLAAHRHARHVIEHAAALRPRAPLNGRYRHRSPNRSLRAQQMTAPLGGALSACMTATANHYNECYGASWPFETTRNSMDCDDRTYHDVSIRDAPRSSHVTLTAARKPQSMYTIGRTRQQLVPRSSAERSSHRRRRFIWSSTTMAQPL